MSPDSKPFPIYQLQDAFESFCNGEPLAKPQHRSLYYFLLGYCRRRGNTPRFSLAYEAGMHGSGIGSWTTYDSALKALAEWGFIQYTPGANRFKVPVVELTFRNPTDDVLLTYWQSYCLSTSNPTDDVLATQLVTLKEVLKEEKEKVGKLESREAHYQSTVAAGNAALALAEEEIGFLKKKCGQLETENAALKAPPPEPDPPLHVSHRAEPEPAPESPAAQSVKPPRQPRAKRTVHSPRPEIAFTESEFADFERFAAAFEGTDYEMLDLRFYHQKILNWRQKGEAPTRKDWKATAVTFFLNDQQSNSLKLAPGVERYDASAHGAIGAGNAVGPNGAAPAGQGPAGYRSSRY